MNITKASLFGILAAAALLHAASSWTLEACLKQAAEKSLSLETAKLREQQAQVNVKQAKIGHYPTVSASIQNTLYDHPFVDQEDHYRLNLGLNGSVTLWDGGATSLNVEAKELSREAAELSTLQTKRTVQENVLNAYMSLLLAKENLRTADYAVEVAQAEFEYFTNLYGVGSVTKKDLTQSEASVLQKQAAKITAELKVSTARTTLRQLLELLFDNAVKYAKENGFISVVLKQERRDLILRVRNNCDSLPAADPDQLFERFFRADQSRSRQTGGSGIGLAVVRAIAQKNGGKATAGYPEDDVIEFEIILPLVYNSGRKTKG